MCLVRNLVVLQPEGLSDERKKYLFNEVREFVAEQYRDLVCPDPQDSVQTDENNNVVHTEGVTPAQPSTRGVGRPKKKPRGLAKRIKLA